MPVLIAISAQILTGNTFILAEIEPLALVPHYPILYNFLGKMCKHKSNVYSRLATADYCH